VHTQW